MLKRLNSFDNGMLPFRLPGRLMLFVYVNRHGGDRSCHSPIDRLWWHPGWYSSALINAKKLTKLTGSTWKSSVSCYAGTMSGSDYPHKYLAGLLFVDCGLQLLEWLEPASMFRSLPTSHVVIKSRSYSAAMAGNWQTCGQWWFCATGFIISPVNGVCWKCTANR